MLFKNKNTQKETEVNKCIDEFINNIHYEQEEFDNFLNNI